MALTIPQQTIANNPARHRIGACGRRFGKTYLSIREMARFARVPKQRVWYVSPTYRMCKQNLWAPLKERLLAVRWASKFNEQDLTAHLKNGSTISLRGADNYNSLRGVGLNFLVIDEASDVDEEAWTQALSPTLSDTLGSVLFLGTPRGRNWFHRLWERGQDPEEQDWASWQFTTLEGGNVSRAEVEAKRRDLDEISFDQEYNASFVTFEGRAYYPFTRSEHCIPANKDDPRRLTYNPIASLIICLDFNVEPGIAVICQEQRLPNGLDGTGVIGEVHIPRNSNTPAVCRKIAHDWGGHEGPVHLYGDQTGGSRKTSQIHGTDWDLVKAELRPVFGDRLILKLPPVNPPERSRVVAMNSRLKSAAGEIRLMVDPMKAPNLVRDLEGVRRLKGGSGELDKKADPELSHMSDAVGYYVEKRFSANRDLVVGELVRMDMEPRLWQQGRKKVTLG